MDPERFVDVGQNIIRRHPQIETLMRLSFDGTPYHAHGRLYRLIAHKTYDPAFADHLGIAGALGLMLLNPDTMLGVALMGYNIIYHEGKLTASIVHTPQGVAYFRAEKDWLRAHHTFRVDMVKDSLDLFKQHDITQVQVISAQNHEKARSGAITSERASETIDYVAWDSGISKLDGDGNWVVQI